MTLASIATSWVLTLTNVVVEVRGAEEDLDAEDKLEEAYSVVGEGYMDSLPRTRSMIVPILPSDITLRISTVGSVLHRSRRFGITKAKILYLPARIRVITLQLRNQMCTSVRCMPLLRPRINVSTT